MVFIARFDNGGLSFVGLGVAEGDVEVLLRDRVGEVGKLHQNFHGGFVALGVGDVFDHAPGNFRFHDQEDRVG